MRLSRAQKIARRLVQLMEPWCERVEIAGSVRRCKAEVKDIEIVAIPKCQTVVAQRDMFGAATAFKDINLLLDNLNPPALQWIKPGTSEIIPWERKPNGKYWRGYIKGEDLKVDIFLTYDQHNFGVIHLLRTGSKEFTTKIMMPALKKRGYKFDEGNLVELTDTGQPAGSCYCPDEKAIFRLAGLKYVEPVNRSLTG